MTWLKEEIKQVEVDVLYQYKAQALLRKLAKCDALQADIYERRKEFDDFATYQKLTILKTSGLTTSTYKL